MLFEDQFYFLENLMHFGRNFDGGVVNDINLPTIFNPSQPCLQNSLSSTEYTLTIWS